jgi:hypothetical protein
MRRFIQMRINQAALMWFRFSAHFKARSSTCGIEKDAIAAESGYIQGCPYKTGIFPYIPLVLIVNLGSQYNVV